MHAYAKYTKKQILKKIELNVRKLASLEYVLYEYLYAIQSCASPLSEYVSVTFEWRLAPYLI